MRFVTFNGAPCVLASFAHGDGVPPAQRERWSRLARRIQPAAAALYSGASDAAGTVTADHAASLAAMLVAAAIVDLEDQHNRKPSAPPVT